jgi:hypothetical protein
MISRFKKGLSTMSKHHACMAQPCYCTTTGNEAFCQYCWGKVPEETRNAINTAPTAAMQVLAVVQAISEVKLVKKAQGI